MAGINIIKCCCCAACLARIPQTILAAFADMVACTCFGPGTPRFAWNSAVDLDQAYNLDREDDDRCIWSILEEETYANGGLAGWPSLSVKNDGSACCDCSCAEVATGYVITNHITYNHYTQASLPTSLVNIRWVITVAWSGNIGDRLNLLLFEKTWAIDPTTDDCAAEKTGDNENISTDCDPSVCTGGTQSGDYESAYDGSVTLTEA